MLLLYNLFSFVRITDTIGFIIIAEVLELSHLFK